MRTLRRKLVVYIVELGPGELYVGSTRRSIAERYATHKAGGRTASGIVRRRGRRLRPDLTRPGETETQARRRLEAAGWRVFGSARPMHLGPPRKGA